MFNFGLSELVILGIIALFVIGPEKLPGVARSLVKVLNELKGVTAEIMKPVDQVKRDAQKIADDTKKSVLDAAGKEEIQKAFTFDKDDRES